MTTQRGHERKPGALCVCPKCGETVASRRGVPCQKENCPVCGGEMLREGSPHHQLLLKLKNRKGNVDKSIDAATG
jgi:hypothetical protein